MKFYKLQSKANPEMFVRGTPKFHHSDKNGRLFEKIGDLRKFLTLVMNNEYRRKEMANWQVVEFEMAETAKLELTDIIKPEKIMNLLKSL